MVRVYKVNPEAHNPRDLIDALVQGYRYAKLPKGLSPIVQAIYLEDLPKELSLDGGSCRLETWSGTKISDGYKRIVIGDYGAFIEIEKSQMNLEVLRIAPGEEYRVTEKYRDLVKYFWFTIPDGSGIKIYYQQQTVKYADYQPKLFYVSPYEVLIKGKAGD